MNQKEIRTELKNMRKGAFHNNKLLPQNKINLGSMRLNFLYQENFQLALFGFANASIVQSGILLETLLKEILYKNNEYDYSYNLTFKPAIEKCKKYLTKKEYKDLHYIREFIRNPTQHHNLKELLGLVKTKGVMLNTKTGQISDWREINSEELRTLETLGKILKYDGEVFIKLFRYTHYLSKSLSRKYLI